MIHRITLLACASAVLVACSDASSTESSSPTGTDPTTPGVTEPVPGEPGPTTPGPGSENVKPPTIVADKGFTPIVETTHELYAAAPGPDGLVYVAMRAAGGNTGWGNGAVVRRYLASGAIDTSFASQGSLATKLVANPAGLGVDADGNVLVGGSGFVDSDLSSGPDDGNEVVVVRVLASGTIDTAYGSGGRAILTDFARANVWTTSLRVRDDGGVFVSVYGRTNGNDAWGSFLLGPTGTGVAGYGSAGFLGSPIGTDGAIALGDDVAVPTTSGLTRYGKDGKSKGKLIADAVFIAKAAPDGSYFAIVVNADETLAVAHFTSNGKLDPAFVEVPVGETFTDLFPLEGGGALVAEGDKVKWVAPKGGTPIDVMPGTAVARFEAAGAKRFLAVGADATVRRFTY